MKQPKDLNTKIYWFLKFTIFETISIFVAPFIFVLIFLFIPIPVIYKIFLIALSTIAFLFLFKFSKPHNTRLYVVAFRAINFLFLKRKFKPKLPQLVPYEFLISDTIIQTKQYSRNSAYVSVIKFNGIDLWTEDELSKNAYLKQFISILDRFETKFQIIKKRVALNYDKNIQQIKNIKPKNKTNIKYQKYLLKDFENLSKTTSYNAYYFVIYTDLFDKKSTLFNHTTLQQYLLNYLSQIKLSPKLLENNELIDFATNFLHQKVIFNSNIHKDLTLPEQSTQAMNSIEINASNIKLDDKYYQFSSITEFPTNLDEAWARELFLAPCDIVWTFNPLNYAQSYELLEKSQKVLEVNSTESINMQLKADQNEYDIIQSLQNAVQIDKNSMLSQQMLFINSSDSVKDLEDNQAIINQLISRNKMVANTLKYRQWESYLQTFLTLSNNLPDSLIMISPQIANSWPFHTDNVKDDGTLYLADSLSTNSNLVLDFFSISQQRTNHNIFINGVSGRGKSTLLSLLISNNHFLNQKQIILDVENEYSDLVVKLGGKNIDLGLGSNTKINPLVIPKMDMENDDDIDSEKQLNQSKIWKHIEYLEKFFEIIFPYYTHNEIEIIKTILNDLYIKNGYLDNIYDSKRKPLILTDLIKHFDKYKFTGDLTDSKVALSKQIKDDLITKFDKNGEFNQVFNTQTSLAFDNNLICINTKNLRNNGYTIRAQAFEYILISLLNDFVFNNTGVEAQPQTIYIDEAHVYLNKNNTKIFEKIFELFKRARKYKTSMVATTQNPADFFIETQSGMNGANILSNCQYSFLFQLKQNDIQYINKIYSSNSNGLTISEILFLSTADRGQALFILNQQERIRIQIHYNDFHKELFFKYKETNEKT